MANKTQVNALKADLSFAFPKTAFFTSRLPRRSGTAAEAKPIISAQPVEWDEAGWDDDDDDDWSKSWLPLSLSVLSGSA